MGAGAGAPGHWGRVAECSKALSSLSPNARASHALYRRGTQPLTPEVQRSVFNPWENGAKVQLSPGYIITCTQFPK